MSINYRDEMELEDQLDDELAAATGRIQVLEEALRWYTNKKNLEDRIWQKERWRPADPDYRHTESGLYDDVCKVALEALGMKTETEELLYGR